MGLLQSFESGTTNPLDLIERLAERRDWSVDRTNDCEVTMVMGGVEHVMPIFGSGSV